MSALPSNWQWLRRSVLVLSVGLNIIVAAQVIARYRTPPATAAAARVIQPVKPVNAVEPAVPADPWDGSLASLPESEQIRRLRSAGVPDEIAVSLISAQLEERLGRRRAEVFYPADTPFWKMGRARGSDLKEIDQERAARLQELLGGLAGNQVDLASLEKSVRFGDLDPRKVAQVEAIEDEITKIRTALQLPDSPEREERIRFLESERIKELQSVLTAAEFADYDLRNSADAISLGRQLRAIDLTEDEFAQLVATRRDADARRGTASGSPELLAPEAEERLYREYEAILGPQRFEEYLRNTSPEYRAMEELLEAVGSGSGIGTQVWEVGRRAMRELSAAQTKPLAPADRQARIEQISARIRNELGGLLDPASAAQLERLFLRHGSTPATSGPGGG